MTYIIGSFNLYRFSGQSDKDIKKNVVKIANIIKSERFDIVALQELLPSDQPKDVIINKMLLSALGSNWDMVGSYLDTKEFHDYCEGYAYLWNSKRVRLINDSWIYGDFGVASKLVRPPLIARFTPMGLPGGSFFEVRLINTHVAFGKPEKSSAASDVDYRRQELKVLAEEVYPRVADERYGDNKAAYTIMIGDYNLCISGKDKIKPWNENIEDGFVDLPISGFRSLRTLQSEKTTLKRIEPAHNETSKKDSEREDQAAEVMTDAVSDYYSQDYDHVSSDVNTLDIIGVTVSRVDALEKYYSQQLREYRREISDHVPIKICINMRRNN